MDAYVIDGGQRLVGSVKIEGSKNAILPDLAATILCDDICELYNCPNIIDTMIMQDILKFIGCRVQQNNSTIRVDSTNLSKYIVNDELVKEMRSSIIIMGAMLARLHKVVINYPGGCEIGARPIDLHLKGLRQLGVNIKEEFGVITCEADALVGNDITLDFPSVGATENIMLAATMAKGTTIIRNAAREPEIADLQNFLNKLGARVRGSGSSIIKIEGVSKLHGAVHSVIPDRIVAGTYLCAACMTHGNIEIEDVNPEHINSLIYKLKEVGCRLNIKKTKVEIHAPNHIKSVENTKTMPYPGFPTDLQSQLVALCSMSNGTSVITENIFENRFKYVPELTKMGAKITLEGRTAIVKGVERLTGATVEAKDLRGGAALVLAGLAAEGQTVVTNVKHIERGYDNLEGKLVSLGAKIQKTIIWWGKNMINNKRKYSRTISNLFIVLMFFVTFLLLIFSPLFTIKNIEVMGISKLTKTDILNISQIVTGENIFRFSIRQAVENLKKDSYIRNTKIERIYPNTVRINIEERYPLGLINFMGSYIAVDHYGYVIDTYTDANKIVLPIIKGVKVDKYGIGQNIKIDDIRKLDALKEILLSIQRLNLLSNINYINIEDTYNISVFADNKFDVKIGDIKDMDYKIRFLKAILEENKKMSQGTIDVSNIERPTFRP